MSGPALVPMSGTQIQKEGPEEESPTSELATGMAMSALMTAFGVPAPIIHAAEMGHHMGEAFHMEGNQMDNGEPSSNLDPGALRPDARIKLR